MITLPVLEILIPFQLRFQQNLQWSMWNLLFSMANVRTTGVGAALFCAAKNFRPSGVIFIQFMTNPCRVLTWATTVGRTWALVYSHLLHLRQDSQRTNTEQCCCTPKCSKTRRLKTTSIWKKNNYRDIPDLISTMYSGFGPKLTFVLNVMLSISRGREQEGST